MPVPGSVKSTYDHCKKGPTVPRNVTGILIVVILVLLVIFLIQRV